MMKKTIVCCYLAVISLCAFAQRSSLKDAYTFGNSITAAELKHYLYIVAGPEMEGRETATNGQRKAAAYLEEQFKAIGLTPPTEGKYQQAYPVVGENLEKAGLEINSYTFPLTVDFIPVTSLNYNASQYFSEVVYVNKGEAADYSGTSVKGKLVLIRGIEFNSSQEKIAIAGAQRKMQEALNQGAAAVLLVQTNFPRSSTAKKLQQSLTKYKATQWPNTYFVSEKVAEKIVGDSNWTKALAGKLPIQKFKSDIALTFEKKQENLESTNVIGLIKGTENQNECIVISAHYDHIGIEDGKINYGADDDGSGTVALLEIAQAFMKASAAGKGPKRPLYFWR